MTYSHLTEIELGIRHMLADMEYGNAVRRDNTPAMEHYGKILTELSDELARRRRARN